MPKVKVFNMAGESVGTLTLKDEVFAVEESLLHTMQTNAKAQKAL